jgi:hypothetical protein
MRTPQAIRQKKQVYFNMLFALTHPFSSEIGEVTKDRHTV